MSDMSPETVVIVDTPDEPVTDESTIVVVEAAPADDDDATDAVVVEAAIDQAMDIGALTVMVQTLAQQVEELSFRTNMAENAADAAIDIAVEATDVAVGVGESVEVTNENVEEIAEEEDIEIDNPPNPLPWTHRTFGNLFGGK